MNINEALNELKKDYGQYFPQEALMYILSHPVLVEERLLFLLEYYMEDFSRVSINNKDYLYAIFCLGQFRSPFAFKTILRFISFLKKHEHALAVMDISLTEDIADILVRCYQGDPSAACQVLLNEQYYIFTRVTAFDALCRLVYLDKISLSEFLAYCRNIFKQLVLQPNSQQILDLILPTFYYLSPEGFKWLITECEIVLSDEFFEIIADGGDPDIAYEEEKSNIISKQKLLDDVATYLLHKIYWKPVSEFFHIDALQRSVFSSPSTIQ